MLAGLTMSRLLSGGTVLANRAAAPATTGLATDVPEIPLPRTQRKCDDEGICVDYVVEHVLCIPGPQEGWVGDVPGSPLSDKQKRKCRARQ